MRRLCSVNFTGRLCGYLVRPISTANAAHAPRAPGGTKGVKRGRSAAALSDSNVSEILDGLDFSDAPPRVPEVAPAIAPAPVESDFTEEEDDKPKKRLPADVRCFDTARIFVNSGDGGNGCVAFRREKFVAKGGPSGGDGGRGGHVWAVAESGLNSLLSFRRQIHWRAKKGTHGTGSNCTGSQGEDLYIPVPPGTIIRMRDAEEGSPPLAELLQPGDKAVLLAGGRGGRGNASFKRATNNAPTMAEKGEAGAEAWVDLELKLVADVGIIGVPNAGKSTLLSSLSAAKPKIADYPFTTLVPNLGVCELDYQTTVFADVPGLLEGAAEGIGLGHEFLRHCMRCKALVHVIDGTSRDPLGDFEAIQLELELFNPSLRRKPQVVCYNKMDIPDAEEFWPDVKECLVEAGVKSEHIFPISAVARTGINPVIRRARQLLAELEGDEEGTGWETVTNALNHQSVPKPSIEDERVENYTIEELKHLTPKVWIIHGKALERFTQMTNWNYYESLRRFHKVLDATGITKTLRERGIKEGDDVVIGEMEFNWNDDTSEESLYTSWSESRASEGRPRMGRKNWPHIGG
ncbi:hypothetical protein BSKO_09009 [Bryopsis sp. KO-2023]|nr:hypothetical protein BSKO_09009 [Bryopsis sp. KO-2023]